MNKTFFPHKSIFFTVTAILILVLTSPRGAVAAETDKDSDSVPLDKMQSTIPMEMLMELEIEKRFGSSGQISSYMDVVREHTDIMKKEFAVYNHKLNNVKSAEERKAIDFEFKEKRIKLHDAFRKKLRAFHQKRIEKIQLKLEQENIDP